MARLPRFIGTCTAIAAVMSSASALAAPARVEARAAGLNAPAEIIVDKWGIAHIYASTTPDAFFLQGYNAARDRLWQIDLWRKRGLGRLAKSFGPAYVEQDRAARLFLYRGSMEGEWRSYAPEARGWVEAFAAGINAFVREVQAGRQPLPVEFKLTDSMPELWAPEDVVRIRTHALASNVASEVARARVACGVGLEADKLRRKLEPPHEPVLPQGLDPCSVPADVLRVYELATKAVEFEALKSRGAASAALPLKEGVEEGSNAWVVAPSRTATGRPILANDPHRQHGAPSLRYIVHLNAPGFSVIGAGEPALPGVSLGHNGSIAFGLTIFGIDQEDLYVYDLKTNDPLSYRYRGGFEPMRHVRETIEVKGAAPRTADLYFTRHGPVIASDGKGRAFALRTVWAEPGTSAYFASSWYQKATNWAEFRRANRHWGTPPLNLVYADTKGNIGWSPSGRTPVRPGWDGLLPVPGDGRFEWKGFLAGADLPVSYNPAKGWFATANEMNLPKDYPAKERKLSFEWADTSRSSRIGSVLAADDKVSVEDAMALQLDTYSGLARRATALLAHLSYKDAKVQKALAGLKSWDHRVDTDSWQASLAETWIAKHLTQALTERLFAPEARPLFPSLSRDAAIDYLAAPDSRLGPNPAAARDGILIESLGKAIEELEARLGPDMTSWTWGKLHKINFVPATAPLAGPELAARMTIGPYAVRGSGSTPAAASYGPEFDVRAGASVRIVLDVGAWDRSVAINAPGQSGDPNSPHYRDLAPLWAEGRFVPLLYSRKAVENAAETIIRLSPSGR